MPATPNILRHGNHPDILSFVCSNNVEGYAVVVSRPVGQAEEVTAEIIRRYNLHPHLVSLLQRLEDAVEALDGTSTDNEALVDEYRALLANIGG